jgi:peptide/nickel transport system substrate-binding protein/oligopeptide transport system substrate-binding protein
MKTLNSRNKLSSMFLNVLLVVMFVSLSACGNATATQPPVAELPTPVQLPTGAMAISTTSAEATPAPEATKYGGVLRVGVSSDLNSLDGPNCEWVDWWLAGKAIYDRLYEFDANSKFIPMLAADYPVVSADGLTYTIKLRQGVKFHNGREMTAEDVKYSIDRNFAANVFTCSSGYFSNIEGAKEVMALVKLPDNVDLTGTKVIDKYTLEIKLTTLTPPFAFSLATMGTSVVPMQEAKAAGADWATKTVIGTGPFKLKEWKAGEKITLERNPDYWKTGLPYLDGIDITLNIAPAAAVLAFENRELDFYKDVPVEDAKRLLADPKYKDDVSFADVGPQRFLWLSLIGPMADVRFRQAVSMAISKEAQVQPSGGASIVWDQIFSPSMPQADPNFKNKWAYNPEEAAKIVKELYPNGVTINFWTWDVSSAEMIQADLKEVGITLEINQKEWGLVQDDLESGVISMRYGGIAYDVPDGTNWTLASASTGFSTECDPNDKTRWVSEGPCIDKVNAWIRELNKLALTDPQRNEILRQLQDFYLNEQVHYIFLTLNRSLDLSASYVKDMPADPVFLFPSLENAWIDQVLKDQVTK